MRPVDQRQREQGTSRMPQQLEVHRVAELLPDHVEALKPMLDVVDVRVRTHRVRVADQRAPAITANPSPICGEIRRLTNRGAADAQLPGSVGAPASRPVDGTVTPTRKRRKAASSIFIAFALRIFATTFRPRGSSHQASPLTSVVPTRPGARKHQARTALRSWAVAKCSIPPPVHTNRRPTAKYNAAYWMRGSD